MYPSNNRLLNWSSPFQTQEGKKKLFDMTFCNCYYLYPPTFSIKWFFFSFSTVVVVDLHIISQYIHFILLSVICLCKYVRWLAKYLNSPLAISWFDWSTSNQILSFNCLLFIQIYPEKFNLRMWYHTEYDHEYFSESLTFFHFKAN